MRVIVLAWAGTEETLRKVWEKHFPEDFRILTVTENERLPDFLVEKVIADADIPDRFVLVPPDLIPCTRILPEELLAPRVYVFNDKETWWGRTPVCFDKTLLEDFLPENDALPDDDFVRKYLESLKLRASQVSYSFGNFVTPVLRAEPCWAKVIEAMLRKKFIFASPTGFRAIETLITRNLL